MGVMKKFVLAIAVAAVACSPALAAKKHHRKHVAAAQPATFAELNDNGYRLVRDSLPVYYPSIVKMVLYPVGGGQK
jgi:hypothetical protein